jgi:CRP-like cAMP-binding protein
MPSVHPEGEGRELMEIGRRSGRERRSRDVSVHGNRRRGLDRREILKDPDRTTGRLRTIPMFEGLSTEQLGGLLTICSKKTYGRNERIFLAGDESTEMFILIQGKLRITFADGEELESCSPAGIVGELGIITGEKRTATVTAATECIVLSFRKEELLALFDARPDLRTRMLTNVIRDLVKKLEKDKEVLEGLRRIRSFEVL